MKRNSVFLIFLVGAIVSELTGCAARVIPPTELTWVSKGVSLEKVHAALRQCSEVARTKTKMPADKVLSQDGWATHDLCMLNKGFKYEPNPAIQPSWYKSGTWSNVSKEELNKCANKNSDDKYGLTTEEIYANLDALKSCMKNKGFIYKPSEGTWGNICDFSTFEDSIACQSTRWGFTLPPEK